ncbi:major facilitator superfamily domain-containing protein [Dactylonectria macrodidyma]|uniref:Major facilitator superfamily domain-containing protein n=1 Tax=Dactylonectria macrodidyma TaxID=307937 RepID=A0A9P9JQB2_9HYPO|nr:major facilitator superfamily domain-containing protein [Dactylonectria macrodidyma]
MSAEKGEGKHTSSDTPPDTEPRASFEDATAVVFIDPEKERATVRKFDCYVLPQFIIIKILSYLDRINIGNARIFGFEEDLNFKGNDFANLTSLFYVTYVIFEIPWVLAVKRYGANSVIAIAIILWSIVVISTGFIHSYTHAVVLRLILGFTEAGIFPALSFLISTIYPRGSQAKRIAVLYGSTALAGAFGGLIAYAIQMMGDRLGIAAWRWLFIIEGAISIVFGLACWATLPRSSEEAWFLKEDEKRLMKDRRARDIVYTGSDEFSWSYVWMALTDTMVWAAGLSLFCAGVLLFGFGTFLPTIIKGLGFESFWANYLTIPVYITGCIILALVTFISDRLQKRAAVVVLVPLIVIIGYAIPIGTSVVGAGFFATFLCSGLYTYNTLLVTWVSNNIKPDRKRSAALPFFVSIANISGVVSGQVYPTKTAPRSWLAAGIVVIYFIPRRRNQIKDKQRTDGITDNWDKGDKSLDFEYIL